MTHHVFGAAALALPLGLVACTTTSGDGIQPEPETSSTTAASSGAGGGENPDWNPQTADALAEQLPGRYSNVEQAEASSGTIPAKQFAACRVTAPEVGKRVIYVERSDLASPDEPDRQLLFVVEPMSPAYYEAKVRVFHPVDAGSWIRACDGAGEIDAPGDIEERDSCQWYASYNDATFAINVGLDPASPPECVAGSPEGTTSAGAVINLSGRTASWTEWFTDADGNVAQEPSSPDGFAFVRLEQP